MKPELFAERHASNGISLYEPCRKTMDFDNVQTTLKQHLMK